MGAVLVEWRWKRHVGDAGCSGYGDTHKRNGQRRDERLTERGRREEDRVCARKVGGAERRGEREGDMAVGR